MQADLYWVCATCHTFIYDKVTLEVDSKRYHVACLRCHSCNQSLEKEEKCYTKLGMLYCKTHYYKNYGKMCCGCMRTVYPEDWVRYAASSSSVYHLACFSCVSCKRQLSTGEQYGVVNDAVYCLTHYNELLADPSEQNSDAESKRKLKRVRTTFNDVQIRVLQRSFGLESNPDSAELDRLSSVTSLSKRVIQVWFQNARARHKKFYTKSSSPLLRVQEIMPQISCDTMGVERISPQTEMTYMSQFHAG